MAWRMQRDGAATAASEGGGLLARPVSFKRDGDKAAAVEYKSPFTGNALPCTQVRLRYNVR